MLKNYITIAVRTVRRQKAYAAINVTGLAVGLACAFFILLWVQDELSHDRFLKDGDRIHRVWRNVTIGDEIHTWGATAGPVAEALETGYSDVEHAVPLFYGEFIVTNETDGFRESGVYVGEAFFDVFAFPLLQGDPATALANPNNAVITEQLAQKLFGESWQDGRGVLGRHITVDQRKDFTITGVLADYPDASSFQSDLLLPFQDYVARNDWATQWGANGFPTFVKLREGASAATVSEQIAGVVMANEEGADEVLFLQPYEDLYLYSEYEDGQLAGGRIEYVRIFSVVAVFLLLIAAINFMNLATARSMKRAREIGVRKALGAPRGALVRQFLGEAVAMALFAFGVALGLAYVLLPVFNDLMGTTIAPPPLGSGFLVVGLGIALTVGLLAGSYPALYLSSFRPTAALRDGLQSRPGATVLRKSLVVFQFALSTLLIVATAAVFLQVRYIQDRDLGLDRDNLIYTPLEGQMAEQYDVLRENLLARPSIEHVTAANANPLQLRRSTGSATWEGKDPETERETYILGVGYDFAETMQMNLASGRTFSPAFGADSSSILVNQEMARVMGGGNVLGRQVTIWGETLSIVGVVEDFDMNSLYESIEPVVMWLMPEGASSLYVRAAPGQTAEALASLEAAAADLNPDYPFTYSFVDAEYAARYESEAVAGRLATVFAVLAIFVSCLGLFGLAAYTAEQRKRELGVRKVLGASVTRLVLLLTGEATKLVVLGIALALPVSYYVVHRWLADFEHHIDVGVGLFAAAGLAAVLIAWVTVGSQALRAATTDPVNVLRSE